MGAEDRSSAPMYYCERKRKVKWGRPGTEATGTLHFRYLSSQEAARREQANLQSDLEKVRSPYLCARAHKNGHLE